MASFGLYEVANNSKRFCFKGQRYVASLERRCTSPRSVLQKLPPCHCATVPARFEAPLECRCTSPNAVLQNLILCHRAGAVFRGPIGAQTPESNNSVHILPACQRYAAPLERRRPSPTTVCTNYRCASTMLHHWSADAQVQEQCAQIAIVPLCQHYAAPLERRRTSPRTVCTYCQRATVPPCQRYAAPLERNCPSPTTVCTNCQRATLPPCQCHLRSVGVQMPKSNNSVYILPACQRYAAPLERRCPSPTTVCTNCQRAIVPALCFEAPLECRCTSPRTVLQQVMLSHCASVMLHQWSAYAQGNTVVQ